MTAEVVQLPPSMLSLLERLLVSWARDEFPSTSYSLTEYVWTATPQRIVFTQIADGRWALHARVKGGEFISASADDTPEDAIGILRQIADLERR